MRHGRTIESYLRHFCGVFTAKDVLNYIDRISDLKILVIGEAVIDEYIYGEVIGKSNKSPSLVFSPGAVERFAGVPMNIANHLSDFCNHIDLKIMVGKDELSLFAANSVDPNVNVKFYHWDSPTIVKRRYVASYDNSKVFEVYDFKEVVFDDSKLIVDLATELNKYDLVIVGDSGHGMMTHSVRRVLEECAGFLALNTQTNAGNIGTHSAKKYMDRKHSIYICVNQREFRLAVHEEWDKYSNVDDLLASTSSDTIALTMGPAGCKISRGYDIATIPAFVHDVVDPVGAGDAFLSITSPLAFMEAPPDIIGLVGNIAGGLHSLCQGNKEYIKKTELIQYITELIV